MYGILSMKLDLFLENYNVIQMGLFLFWSKSLEQLKITVSKIKPKIQVLKLSS